MSLIIVSVFFLQLILIRQHHLASMLFYSPLLPGDLLSQYGQLGFRAGDGLFIIPNVSPSQTEGELGFLDLLVDGAHIAREIVGVRQQRDNQFMKRISRILSVLLIFSLVFQTAFAEDQVVAIYKSYETEKEFSIKANALVKNHSAGKIGELKIQGDGLTLLV